MSRERLPNGAEVIYIKNPDTGCTYFTKVLSVDQKMFGEKKGTGKGRGRTRGKPGNIQFNQSAMKEIKGELGYVNLGFLFDLSSLSRYDNGLVAKRGKPLTPEGISLELGVSKATVFNRLKDLLQAGVVTREPDGYHIHRKYITKG